MTDTTTTIFAAVELNEFARFSGDRNPIHMDAEAALSVGMPDLVVQGALIALSTIHSNSIARESGYECQFLKPILCGVDYKLRTASDRSRLDWEDSRGEILATISVQTETGVFVPEGPSSDFIDIHWQPGVPSSFGGKELSQWDIPFAIASFLAGSISPGASGLMRFLVVEQAVLSGLSSQSAYVVRCFLPQGGEHVAWVLGSRNEVIWRLKYRSVSASGLEWTAPKIERTGTAGHSAVVIGATHGVGAALTFRLGSRGCRVTGSYLRSERQAAAFRSLAHDHRLPISYTRADARDPRAMEILFQCHAAAGEPPAVVFVAAFPNENGGEHLPDFEGAAVAIAKSVLTGISVIWPDWSGTLVYISSTLVGAEHSRKQEYRRAKRLCEEIFLNTPALPSAALISARLPAFMSPRNCYSPFADRLPTADAIAAKLDRVVAKARSPQRVVLIVR